MADLIDPFMTFLNQNSEFGSSDEKGAVNELFIRQGLIEDFLEGKEGADTVLDCLDEHGIDPAAFVAQVEDSVQQIIQRDDPYIQNSTGLFLPRNM